MGNTCCKNDVPESIDSVHLRNISADKNTNLSGQYL